MINDSNYELWLLRYAEGELDATRREAVEAWLATHPEAAEELALYNEAPRLREDKSVRYGAVPQRRTQPLWPALVRWSAAAAVVAALMVPAFRMGTMGTAGPQPAEAPLLAQAETQAPAEYRESRIARESRITRASSESTLPGDTAPAAPQPLTPPAPEPIQTTSLIAIVSEPEADTFQSRSLIAVEGPDWGDLLLARNDAFRDSLSTSLLGRQLASRLPDSRSLEENIVDPIRTRIDNIRHKNK